MRDLAEPTGEEHSQIEVQQRKQREHARDGERPHALAGDDFPAERLLESLVRPRRQRHNLSRLHLAPSLFSVRTYRSACVGDSAAYFMPLSVSVLRNATIASTSSQVSRGCWPARRS